MPPIMAILIFWTWSSSMHFMHFIPIKEMEKAMSPKRMEATIKARVAWRIPAKEDREPLNAKSCRTELWVATSHDGRLLCLQHSEAATLLNIRCQKPQEGRGLLKYHLSSYDYQPGP